MGVAELVPGVSGGTVALITGIYRDLVDSIRAIQSQGIPLWARGDWRAGWQHGRMPFLAVLGLGMATGILSLAWLVNWLLEHQPLPLSGFFFGLILAAIIVIGGLVQVWSPARVALSCLGIAVGIGISAVPALTGGSASVISVFLGGTVAICAWILPGVSGSYVLVLLGLYPVVVEAIAALDLTVLSVLALGCLTGLFLFSGILSWLLERFYASVLALLLGVMLGALAPLWPWLIPASGAYEGLGPIRRLAWPEAFLDVTGSSPHIGMVIGAMVMGAVLVLGLAMMDRGRRGGQG
jgi:putative membrane protein